MRVSLIALAAAFALASAGGAISATQCKDAKGHFVKCPAAAAAKTAAAKPAAKPAMAAKPATKSAKAAAPRTGPAKCKTGVPCGNSCIPKGKVCHK